MTNATVIERKRTGISTRMLTTTAMLAAISFIMAYIEFPLPLSPSFAKIDLSDMPALIAAFAFGPVAGLLVELIKNGLQLLSTSTGGIGELANFIIGGSFILTAGIIYAHKKTKTNARFSCLTASIMMGITAVIANYFLLLPMFEMFMPMEQIVAAFNAFMPFIHTKLDVVLYNALPFNLLKGLIISLFTLFTYKRLTPLLKGVR